MALEKDLMRKAGHGSDLGRSREEEEAQKYRDMLLKADRERWVCRVNSIVLSVVRNRVFDQDADYYNVENGHYLTEEERHAIQRRKDELHRLQLNRGGRAVMVNMDFAAGTVQEVKVSASFQY